jgi:hypothetical protein
MDKARRMNNFDLDLYELGAWALFYFLFPHCNAFLKLAN